ncbi:N-acetyltransferase [Actinoplanes sp. ATCC 53533]|uniref:GNAT family N-acetyltransferase n=1 Tax=Actinoplanes sp. ATCC 53533 TaxID=1288362 RepID=UPI000F771B9D|nr:GNAT family N-acetyltransferase [Actinoplanes sp. ATCC 53533]RSM56813.1 N-acetyltransferase [Actinoplanes sp. ATCC 53533]
MTTTSVLAIRVYRDDDHDQVVILNAYGLAAAGVAVDVDAGDLDTITTTYLTGRATMLVGEIDGNVVAMGALRYVDDLTCEITRMRVDPSVQGRGYGKQILTTLEEHAQRLGYHHAVLFTRPDQHPAIDLYQASGYTITAIENHGDVAGVRVRKQFDVDHGVLS